MKDQAIAVKSWEAGRKNLVEEQKFQRENERTHRAALFVTQVTSYTTWLTFTDLYQVF
jgi:hypothetical protein